MMSERRITSFTALLMVASLLLGAMVTYYSTSVPLKKQNEEQLAVISVLISEKQDLESQISSMDETISEMEDQISTLEIEMDSMTEEITFLETEIARVEEEISAYEVKVSELEAEITLLKERLAEADIFFYRKKITINGSSAGAQTDYQIRVEVDSGIGEDSISVPRIYCYDHCQPDFDDIRFTKEDGVTQLDYWIESVVINRAIIWVEVDEISYHPETTSIYMYYGNSIAGTTSNITETWEWSEVWTSDHTSKYTQYQGYAPYMDYENRSRSYLQQIESELGIRAIQKSMLDHTKHHQYGCQTRWGFTKNADDMRDGDDCMYMTFCVDTDRFGNEAGKIGVLICVNNGGVKTFSNWTVMPLGTGTYVIKELRCLANGEFAGDVYTLGRESHLYNESISNAPDSINYHAHENYYGGGVEEANYWGYDAVDDRLEWGGERSSNGGEIKEETSWTVIGKYVSPEPFVSGIGIEERV